MFSSWRCHASHKGMLLSLKATQSHSPFVFFPVILLSRKTHEYLFVCLFSKILKALFDSSATERKEEQKREETRVKSWPHWGEWHVPLCEKKKSEIITFLPLHVHHLLAVHCVGSSHSKIPRSTSRSNLMELLLANNEGIMSVFIVYSVMPLIMVFELESLGLQISN